jgi:hypothetical protein
MLLKNLNIHTIFSFMIVIALQNYEVTQNIDKISDMININKQFGQFVEAVYRRAALLFVRNV